MNYRLLLPPSEGKVEDVNRTTMYFDVRNSNSFVELNLARDEVYNHLLTVLNKRDLSEMSKVLELKGIPLQKAIIADANLNGGSTLPAIYRYSGVMFKAIDYAGMSHAKKENFNDAVLFVDGMFGLLRPLDLIPDYKLKINSKIPGFDVSRFWRDELKGVLEEEFEGKVVIDILPDAHRRVVDFSSAKEHYEVVFAENVEGVMKNVGHFSKGLKGEFVNFVCSMDNISREDLIGWKHSDGFVFSEKFSGANRIVYCRVR
ncbi:MAG: peroxide stress protein YaaA [Nanoarchaeota archaeon]|jgi:cytoplasmic iron level regulating protein YaaA (DUF328/UPF0246 family)|nr:peroxide stress protein YaaA [Nanoarchaeota archaeon]